MDCSAYILFSAKLDKFYTGASKYTAKRERQHNHGQACWTSRADDWVEVWREPAGDMKSARAVEKRIKSRGARRYLQHKGVQVPPKAG